MSPPRATHIVQVVRAKATGRGTGDAPSESQWTGVEVSTTEACKGVAFQGQTHEDPSDVIRCIEWAGEPTSKIQLPSNLHLTSDTTYRLYASLPDSLAGHPACIEYATFHLKPSVSYAEFAPIWHAALAPVLDTPGCGAVVLGQAVDDPAHIVHIQPWMTLSDHLDGFKNRKDIDEVMGPLSDAVAQCIEGGWGGFSACHLMVEDA